MRFPINLRAATILLIALATAGCKTTSDGPPLPPSTPGGRPALTVPLVDHSEASQRRLADEIAAAPTGAEWPGYIGAYSTTRRAVCAVTPNQAACRRICASEGGRPAFCARAGRTPEGGS